MDRDIDISQTKFCIGMPTSRDLPIQTVLSLLYTFREFDQHGCPLALAFEVNNSIVCSARNKVVHTFLNKTQADTLFFIDSDITWKVEDFLAVAAMSTEYDVVGVAYPTKNDDDPKMFVNAIRDENDKFVTNSDGLLSVEGCGFGFIAIKKAVFEKMMPNTEIYRDGGDTDIYRFFKIDVQDGFLVGEDIYFLKRWVREFGGSAFLIPNIALGHIGQKVYRGALSDTQAFKENT